ncbi:hypothetical protein TNCV_1682781 [Trichonephila clavipes]|nr:hypothetical protein TNCV_1682781 [Trichonephila clavipes]
MVRRRHPQPTYLKPRSTPGIMVWEPIVYVSENIVKSVEVLPWPIRALDLSSSEPQCYTTPLSPALIVPVLLDQDRTHANSGTVTLTTSLLRPQTQETVDNDLVLLKLFLSKISSLLQIPTRDNVHEFQNTQTLLIVERISHAPGMKLESTSSFKTRLPNFV